MDKFESSFFERLPKYEHIKYRKNMFHAQHLPSKKDDHDSRLIYRNEAVNIGMYELRYTYSYMEKT